MKLSSSFITLFAAISAVTAAPSQDSKYPEVIPGPGLPSLAELGLTSEELYTKKPSWLKARGDQISGTCQAYSTASVASVVACYNYLESIGSHACTVSGSISQFCYSGDAQISGINLSGAGSTSSSCTNVAFAVQWIFDACDVNGQVGGDCGAYDNNDLQVDVRNVNY